MSARDQLNKIVTFDWKEDLLGHGLNLALPQAAGVGEQMAQGIRTVAGSGMPGIKAGLSQAGSGISNLWNKIRGPGKLLSRTLLSAREQLDLIRFADPRPRNPLGEFSGSEEGPNPNAIGTVYKHGNLGKDLAIGAAGSVAGAGALTGVKALMAKLKGRKV